MQTYEYRGYSTGGRLARGLVEAQSLKDARAKLAAGGVLADRLARTGRKRRFSAAARAALYRELASLLTSGVPLAGALDIMAHAPGAAAGASLAGVRDRIHEGAPLSEALAEASPSVASFEQALLRAAERAADLDRMLVRLADFLDESEALRQRVQSALVYPLVVLCAGVCVAVLMLGLLLPRTRALFAGSMDRLPPLTVAMIGLGRVLAHWGLPAAAVLAAGAAAIVRAWRRSAPFRARCDRLICAAPLVGHGFRLLSNQRFARTLAILIRGGVPLIEGLNLAGRATGSAWVSELIDREAEAVRHGARLSDALARVPPLAGTLPGRVRIGEAGGNLANLLDAAGEGFQAQWTRFVGLCLSLLEPALILVIGGFVLLVTLSILLPVLDVSRAM